MRERLFTQPMPTRTCMNVEDNPSKAPFDNTHTLEGRRCGRWHGACEDEAGEGQEKQEMPVLVLVLRDTDNGHRNECDMITRLSICIRATSYLHAQKERVAHARGDSGRRVPGHKTSPFPVLHIHILLFSRSIPHSRNCFGPSH